MNQQNPSDSLPPDGIDRKKFKCVKIEDATEPRNGVFNVICDRWWQVTPGREIMLYRGVAPQCYSSRAIAENVRDRIHKTCTVEKIPVIYIPAL